MKPEYMLKAREAIARLTITDLPTIRFIYRHQIANFLIDTSDKV